MGEEKSFTVLVVDDEKLLLDAILFEFEMEGITAHGANNGAEALTVLQAEDIDVVTSDVRMPTMTGIELLDNIRVSEKSKTPVILLSGYTDIKPAEAYSRGADCILAKPFDPAILKAAVSYVTDPPVHRWKSNQGKEISVTEKVELTASEIVLKECSDPEAIILARGGVFIPWEKDPLEVGTRIQLSAKAKSGEISEIEATGIVRWVRNNIQGRDKAGFGLEFECIHSPAPEELWQHIATENPIAFIPYGGK